MTQYETHFDDLLQRLEIWTREGQSQAALRALLALRLREIPRDYRFELARIARRLNHPVLALKIINPSVRADLPNDRPPNEKERIVHAATLTSLGCLSEAEQILNAVNPDVEPDALINLAFIKFRKWEYGEARPLLKRYLQSKAIDEYSRIVGLVNLAAALIADSKESDAIPLLETITEVTKSKSYWLLFGNALELQAQTQISKGEYDLALQTLAQAAEILRPINEMYYFFVVKWQRIVECRMNPLSPEKLAALSALRHPAVTNGYWEGLRDIGLHVAIAKRSEREVHEVLWGTPYKQFHRRAEKFWGARILLGTKGDFPVESTAQGFGLKPLLFDPHDFVDPKMRDLEMQPTLAKGLAILSTDRYRPVRLGALFYELYPNEHFDPFSSPLRVNNVIFRLRRLLKDARVPLGIKVKDNDIQLFAVASNVRLTCRRRRTNRNDGFLELARHHFIGRGFTLTEFCSVSGMSRSFCLRILRNGIQRKIIESVGMGRACRYKFSNFKS